MKDEGKQSSSLDIDENGNVKRENDRFCSSFIKTPFSLWKAVPLRSVGRGGTVLGVGKNFLNFFEKFVSYDVNRRYYIRSSQGREKPVGFNTFNKGDLIHGKNFC